MTLITRSLLAVLLLAATADTARADTGRLGTDDGFTLAYETVGRGPQIVIVPGRLFLFDDLKVLASPERTLIFYDMRNRGRSERIRDLSKISIEHDVRDLEAVRRHFRAERFTVVGYSYLGLMAVLYAKDHPERVERVVQLGPLWLRPGATYAADLDATKDRTWVDGARWAELQRLEKEGFIASHPREYCVKDWEFTRTMLVADARHVDRVPNLCDMENEWPVNLRKHFQALIGSIGKLAVSKDQVAAKVTMPVLTIHGRKDRNTPYGGGREWASVLPDARLLTLERAAHNSWADEPDAVLDALRAFLQGRWPGGAQRVEKAAPR